MKNPFRDADELFGEEIERNYVKFCGKAGDNLPNNKYYYNGKVIDIYYHVDEPLKLFEDEYILEINYDDDTTVNYASFNDEFILKCKGDNGLNYKSFKIYSDGSVKITDLDKINDLDIVTDGINGRKVDVNTFKKIIEEVMPKKEFDELVSIIKDFSKSKILKNHIKRYKENK
jgi:hypothetical protein